MLTLPSDSPLRHVDMLGDDLPVIGQTYLVRAIQTKHGSRYDRHWWPVPTVRPHNDYEYRVGPDALHHHIDVRFITEEMIDVALRDAVIPKYIREQTVLDRIINPC